MKKNILYIVLAVIIVLLIGSIFIISNENNKKRDELLSKVDTESIAIDENVQELYSVILKWNKFENSSDLKENPNEKYVGTFYTNEKVSAFRYTKEQKYAAVFLALKNAEQLPDNSYESKSGHGLDTYQINKYTLEEAKSKMYELFDTDVLEEVYLNIGNEVVEFTQDAVYSFKVSGDAPVRTEYAFGKLEKAEKNVENEEIYLYDKYVYCQLVNNEDGTSKIEVYTNSNKTDKIADDVSDIIDLNKSEDEIINILDEKYGDLIKEYKHTFRKDDNNKYYWASSEIINEF